MTAGVVLVLVALSFLDSVEGSSHVLKAVGDSVQLDAPDPGLEFDDCFWAFNIFTTVLKYYKKSKTVELSPDYKDRVEFNNKTCSLSLKNLRRSDSGRYEVILSTTELSVSKQVDLSVLDPVEAPVLTQCRRNDARNSTFVCRGHDLSIISSCNKEICEEKKETSSGGIVLSLSVQNNSIICNQSNPVSWKEDVMEIKIGPHCAGAVSSTGVSVCLLKTGLYSITLIIMLSAVISVHIRERKNKSS